MSDWWIIVAIDQHKEGWVLDHPPEMAMMLGNGCSAQDNNIYMPTRERGLYRITNLNISEGGWSGGDAPEWEVPEISGVWTKIAGW